MAKNKKQAAAGFFSSKTSKVVSLGITLSVALLVIAFIVWQFGLFERRTQMVLDPARFPALVQPLGNVPMGGPFALIAEDGTAFTEQALLGKPTFLYFGFTWCPDYCPMTLQLMKDAAVILGNQDIAVNQVMVTVDPQRDTVPVLRDYVSFSPGLRGLTGDMEAVEDMLKKWRIYHAINKRSPDDKDYSVDHTIFLYVLDKNGKLAGIFRDDVDAKQLADFVSDYVVFQQDDSEH